MTRSSNDGTDYRPFLKGRGTPTVIACNVPFSMISASTIGELAGAMLQEVFESLIQPDRPDHPIDFGFEIFEPLPPEYIADFFHPGEIRDAFHLD